MNVSLSEARIRWLRDRRIFFEQRTEQRRLRPEHSLVFADHTEVEPYCCIGEGGAVPIIGAFSYTLSALPAGMEIGRYCSIARGVTVPGPRHPIEKLSSSSFMYDRSFSIFATHAADAGRPFANYQHNPQKPLPRIGNDVWVGQGVALMPGISVGDGAVVAAQSVVTKDVPPYAVVGGNPARVIRFRFPAPTIERLLALRWWRYSYLDFEGLPLGDLAALPDRFEAAMADKPVYAPAKIRLADLREVAD